jgi:alkanesulfonate monooxygenase SsuD/methylene tetrahydromethanopterin reductase-like flavin-dependent oxidoreductase (luciferase family)
MNADAGAVKLGIVVGGRPALAADLDAAGVDSLWVGGHVAAANGAAEVLINLARISAVVEHALLGTSVLVLPLYPPALVAKQIADLDRATDGRIVLGVGVGGEFPEEFRACEVPAAERGTRMDEAIGLLRRLWTGESVTHAGAHHAMDDVRVLPAPVHPGGPPIVVAGRKERAMRRAAVTADGWMPYLYSPRRYAASVATITQLAATTGRDLTGFGWFAFVFVNVNADPAVARREAAAAMGANYDQDFDAYLDKVAVAGTPAQVVARLTEFIDAGARHLVLAPAAPADAVDLVARRLAGEVIPQLRAIRAGR